MANGSVRFNYNNYRREPNIFSLLVALILLIGACALLWWSEQGNISKIKDVDFIKGNAIEVSSDSVLRENDLKLIATNGKIYTKETLTDMPITVKNALRLQRVVEMYQWVESKIETSHAGSSARHTTYSYTKKWSSDEIDSDRFHRKGYYNPKFVYKSRDIYAKTGNMGKYKITQVQTSKVGSFKDIYELKPLRGFRIYSHYYFRGRDILNPNIGDYRISYRYVPSGVDISVIGRQNIDNSIGDMETPNGFLYLQYDGIYNLSEILNKYEHSNDFMTYFARVFIFIFISGLSAVILNFVTQNPNIVCCAGTGLIITFLVISIEWLPYRPLISAILLMFVILIAYFIVNYLISNRQ